MNRRFRYKAAAVGLALIAVVAAACSSSSKSSSPSSPSSSNVRGFNGTVIRVAALENFGDFQGSEIGAEARFQRANDDNELDGVKIQFITAANDNQDPATGLSEVRQLVTSDNIFAIVPDLSAVNPTSYEAQEQLIHVGFAFDDSYCSPQPSQDVWGFGYNGCLVTSYPPSLPDGLLQMYAYISQKTGKAHPTIALFSNDNQSGIDSTKFDVSEAEAAGFDVVFAKGNVPITVSDYTPYVQQWMTSASGGAPDVISCYLAAECIPAWTALKAAGYKGTYFQSLGDVSALAGPMAGTVTTNFYNTNPNAGLTQMEADFKAFSPSTQLTGYSNVPAYFAADMFVDAIKAVQKAGKKITAQSVQHQLDNQSWSIPGLVGPISYPESTAVPTPICSELLLDTGTTFQVVEPYSCSSKHVKIDPKFTGQ